MSHVIRYVAVRLVVLSLLIGSSVPALSASLPKVGSWRGSPIIIMCEGYPGTCPCPTC